MIDRNMLRPAELSGDPVELVNVLHLQSYTCTRLALNFVYGVYSQVYFVVVARPGSVMGIKTATFLFSPHPHPFFLFS